MCFMQSPLPSLDLINFFETLFSFIEEWVPPDTIPNLMQTKYCGFAQKKAGVTIDRLQQNYVSYSLDLKTYLQVWYMR